MSSVLTHLIAAVSGALTAIGFFLLDRKYNGHIYEDPICQEKVSTLELQIPEVAELNPPHLGVYAYQKLKKPIGLMTHSLYLYPTIAPTAFLRAQMDLLNPEWKTPVETTEESKETVEQTQTTTETTTEESNQQTQPHNRQISQLKVPQDDEELKSNTLLDTHASPVSEKQKTNVQNAELTCELTPLNQSDNSATCVQPSMENALCIETPHTNNLLEHPAVIVANLKSTNS